MILKLKNEILEVAVNSQGAELCAINDTRNQRQWLWTADSNWWPRHAPVLFPVVGKLKDQKYTYDGLSYQMPQHGFARDREHRLIGESGDSLTFSLREDEASLLCFPRAFELLTAYQLTGASISTRWTVKNTGDKVMHFSIGGHPGFLCPLDQDDALEDYQIIFEKEEEPKRWMLDDGLVSGSVPFGRIKSLALSEALFAGDAVIFSELKSRYILFKSKKRSEYIQFDFGTMPFLAFWKKPNAPFVCVEPWHGLADFREHSGQLEEKFGIEKLQPGEEFHCSYTITIHAK